MEWNGQNLIRRHQGRFRTIYFFEKPLVKNTFFTSFPKKTLRLWILKIWICIWSEESTQSVDFMDSWSLFGFAQKNSKSVFGFGNPDLDSENRIWIFQKKRTLTFMSLLMESVRKVIADCVGYLRPWWQNPHWYLENRSREPATSLQRELDQLVCKARDSPAHTLCCPVSGHFNLTLQSLSFLSCKRSEIWPRDNLKSLIWRKTV